MKGSIRLTAAERKMLLSVYRTARDAKRARRAHVILLLDEGVSYRELTRWLFVSNDLIADCVHRFQHGRVRSFFRTLAPGGNCVRLVPAGRWLYTGIDRELGHYRRYARRELAAKIAAAGFDVVYTRRFSRLGALAWAVSWHVLRRRHLSSRQMAWFDRLLPIAKIAEWVLPVPGMSLIMVGRKPGREARSCVLPSS
jgi:hypothetical protein